MSDTRKTTPTAPGPTRKWSGPDAARAIAARHMRAYGNHVWGPTPVPATNTTSTDEAWADACASLTESTTS